MDSPNNGNNNNNDRAEGTPVSLAASLPSDSLAASLPSLPSVPSEEASPIVPSLPSPIDSLVAPLEILANKEASTSIGEASNPYGNASSLEIRIASLLAKGASSAQISSIVGLSPGRISQLTSTPEFQLLLSIKQEENKQEDIEETTLSVKYASAEHALLKQIMDLAPAAELRDAVAALKVVSERQEKMKQRVAPSAPSSGTTQLIVAINLPSHVLPRQAIQLSSTNEVISIGDRELAPLPSATVKELFASISPSEKG